ncbi:MAG: SDR family oxidoreductase [Phycisphaerales bacterium]|nr:SDR family oxidoreductase [Phycisphaerales bacterium]
MSVKLVTGGAGFIGSHVVRALLRENEHVRVIDNFSTGHRSNLDEVAHRIELIEGDICDEATAERACKDASVVYHLAARASVPRSVKAPRPSNEVNVTGTLNMLIAARDAGVKNFVYSASSSAYGASQELPKRESQLTLPLSPYAVSKLAGEHYCASFSACYGLSTISLRYFNVFGPRQDPKSDYAAAIPAFATRMLSGERPIVFGDGLQSRDFCYIDNVVQANLKAGATPGLTGQAVNIACGERISLLDIIARVNELLGTKLEPVFEPPRAGDARHTMADYSLATELIGYRPSVMFDEGLKLALDWYRQTLA